MKKIFTLIGILLFVSACKNQSNAPSENYRVKGEKNAWRISGTLNTKFEPILGIVNARFLTVYIEGNPVIQGNLSDSYQGELSGKYKGKDILSVCTSEERTDFWRDVNCMILINNEKTVTLSFGTEG